MSCSVHVQMRVSAFFLKLQSSIANVHDVLRLVHNMTLGAASRCVMPL